MNRLSVKWRKNAIEFGKTLIVIMVGLIIGAILILCVSDEPRKVYSALLKGPLFSVSILEDGSFRLRGMSRFGTFIEDSITLTLVGLAVAIPFQARQFSLGADGQLILGALASALVSIYLPFPAFILLPLACFAALLAGFVWGWLPGVMKAKADMNEIVTTLMLNVIALQIFSYVVLNIIRDPNAGFIVTYLFQEAALLEPILARTHVTMLTFIIPFICIGIYILHSRSNLGYEIRTIGQNINFMRQMGMPAARTITLSMAIGGAIAGLAGFHIANAILKRLPLEFPVGLGFEGILVAILARNNPLLIIPVALLYGYLKTGAQIMERTTDVSREMVLIIQAIIILLIVSENLLPRVQHLFKPKLKKAPHDNA